MLGRAARALDEELNLEYLAQIAEHEDARIDRLVADRPPSGRLEVSIVVPTHGIALPYVRELIESVERQTYANWQLCFCDDGDTEREVSDHLAALARNRPDRFRYARHPQNLGIAAATRTALTLVTGELVAFVDADDTLHRRALEAVVSRFDADERVDFVYTDHDTASDLGFRRGPIAKPGFCPELLQSVNYVNHLVVVRKRCLDRCEGAFADETSGSQDWDLCLRLAGVARRVSHVPAVLYHWRARPGSIAAGGGAKPWVLDACVEMRGRHLRGVDARLCITPRRSDGHVYYEPDLRPDAELPSVRVVIVSGDGPSESEPPSVSYEGRVSTVELRLDDGITNRGLLERLRDRCDTDRDDLVWLIESGRPLPHGELSRMIAFAVQPPVGAVWPFHAQAQAACYTLQPGRDRVAPATQPLHPFARFSGNVLTGSIHGLLGRVEALRACLAHLDRASRSTGVDAGFWDRPAHPDSVGASMGLAMLATGKRNVACRGMVCDLRLGEASPPRALLPDSDPWL